MSVQFPPLLEEHEIDRILALPASRNFVLRHKWLSVLVAGFATFSMTVIIIFNPKLFVYHSHAIPSPPQCGNTTAQALSLDCHFDPMSFSLLPSPCYDPQLTEEFLSLKAWQWFGSPNMTEDAQVTKEEVLKGEHSYLWVSWEYHKLHCTYMWRKLHGAVLKGALIDEYIGNYEHTRHCEEILMRGDEEMKENRGLTVIKTKFVGCQGKDLQ